MIKKTLCTALILSAGFFLYAQHETPDGIDLTPDDYLFDLDFEENDIAAEEQKELNIVFPSISLNLDPHTSAYTGEAQILNSTCEGLFTYDAGTSEPVFAICSSYTTSRDQLYWSFDLRADAKFSDGSKITSENVKASWLKLLSTKDAYYSSFLDAIKGAREYRLGKGSADDVAIYTPEPHRLCIQLVSPVSHLPKILCHHAFSVTGIDEEKYSGPYAIDKIDNKKIVLKKNKFYYDEKNVLISVINIIEENDSTEMAYQFNNGAIHWIDSGCDSKLILDQSTIKLEPLFGTYYFFFKIGNSPYLTEKVRQALMEATPWESLRYGSIFPAGTFVYPIKGYSSPSPLAYTDYDHAKNLMKAAKAELGLAENEIIDLTFSIPEGTSIYQAAELLKEAWARVGVRLKISVNRNPNYYNEIGSSKEDLFIYTWIGDFSDPIAFLELFRSDSNLNESNWKNEEYDNLLNQANITVKEKERLSLLSKAEDILLSSGMIIPITYSIGMNIVNTNEIGGWTENPLNIHPFKTLYFKKARSTFRHGIVAAK